MHTLLTILAQDESQGNPMDMFVMIGMIFLIFWFLVIRPGSKERKQREAAVKALKKNDKVVTNAGIHGTVVGLEDEAVTLRVDDKNNIRMKFSRAAIWQVQDPDAKSGKGKDSKAKGSKKYEKSADAKANDDASDDSKTTPETAAK
ncbi:MAG: preprotein translocase subunit YajC [Planctomycetota bacterium]|nr:preprotein translocase subunit YajC [Planctomycetota bacterium]